jgi:hypothetical protein
MQREGGVTGSQPLNTAVHRSPNKLWRSNSIFNLWWINYFLPHSCSEATARLEGPREIFMREGGPLNITCRFSGHRRPAQFIHWWRGTTLLNTAGRGGIAIHSDKVGICAAQQSSSIGGAVQPSSTLPAEASSPFIQIR